MVVPDRDCESKRCAFPFAALQPEASAMQPGQGVRDGQAQPDPRGTFAVAARHLGEGLEDLLLVSFGNSRPAVFH